MSGNPLISIIMPLYNQQNYIASSVDSVLKQSMDDFELIIVNDCSTDMSLSIAESFDDKRIKIVNHKENKSLHMARYSGVEKAKGEYIIFLDSDDTLTENALEKAAEIIRNNTEFDVCEFKHKRVPENKISELPEVSSGVNRFEYFFSVKYPVQTMWDKIYKTKLLKTAFAQMEKQYINNVEDIYESICIALFTENYVQSEEVLINYTVGTGMSTTTQTFLRNKQFCSNYQNMIGALERFMVHNKVEDHEVKLCKIKKYILEVIFGFANYYTVEEDRAASLLLVFNTFETELILPYFNTIYENNVKYLNGKWSCKNMGKSVLKSIKSGVKSCLKKQS